MSNIIYLVVLTIFKHMKVNGKDHPICYGKKPAIFETTNMKLSYINIQ